MTISDTLIVSGGVAAWGVAMSAIGVLWRRNVKLESVVAKLQTQLSEGLAAKEMIRVCPAPDCPYANGEQPPRPSTSCIFSRNPQPAT